MKHYVLSRAKEPSTWRGLTLILTALGVNIAPELAQAITSAGIGIAGIVGFAFPDSPAK